ASPRKDGRARLRQPAHTLGGFLVLPDPRFNLLEVLGCVVDGDAHEPFVDTETISGYGDRLVPRNSRSADSTYHLVDVEPAGHAGSPPRWSGPEDDAWVIDRGEALLEEAMDQGRLRDALHAGLS